MVLKGIRGIIEQPHPFTFARTDKKYMENSRNKDIQSIYWNIKHLAKEYELEVCDT